MIIEGDFNVYPQHMSGLSLKGDLGKIIALGAEISP